MFINMVPGERFNKMKLNSGLAAAEPYRRSSIDRYLRSARGHSLVIDETREPLPHVARFVEMADNAFRAPSYRKCQASQVRHDGEHALVGHIIANKDRTTALERIVGHQFDDARRLVETGMLDLADAFPWHYFDGRIRQVGPDQGHRRVNRLLGMRRQPIVQRQ